MRSRRKRTSVACGTVPTFRTREEMAPKKHVSYVVVGGRKIVPVIQDTDGTD